MDTVPLKFKPQRQYDPRVGESDLRGKEVLVKWAHGDGLEGARDELPPLEMDTIGTYVYPLVSVCHISFLRRSRRATLLPILMEMRRRRSSSK